MDDMNRTRITDFSITDLQMMESTDGYAIRCNLFYKGNKLGIFFDKGDGSEYYFYPEPGHNQTEVENMLIGENFPPIKSLYPGLPPIGWNIDILVEKLIERNNLEKRIVEARKEGRDLVVIYDEANGRIIYVKFLHFAPDGSIDLYVKMNYGENVKWERRK